MAEDLVGKVFSFFSGDNNENLSDKELVLRQRLKELTENKYDRFYRHKTDEADVSLGMFFYTLYKLIAPIRVFMKDTAKTTRLRQIVLEAFIDAGIVATLKRLNPAFIAECAKTTSPEALAAQIHTDIEQLKAGFDQNRMNRINRCYNLIMTFFQLAHFDYPALLKRFDPNFTEGPFGGDPKFSPVKTSLVAKDLGDFLAISQNITPDNDWKTLLKLLKMCAGEDLLSENQFAQMLIGLRDVINSKMLELMVQYGSKNPVWICKPRIPDEHIAEAWLEARTAKAQASIDQINDNEKHKQISALLTEVFPHDELERLENYTLAKGVIYQNKGLVRFRYAEGLNYLAIFLNDHLQREYKELSDILLVRGQWTNIASSKEMSEALHQLMDMMAEVSHLDEMLAEDGSDGSRLKAAMLRVDRDRTQGRYINSIIENINDNALELIENAIEHFSVIDRHLKNLSEDVQKKHPDLIINWRELNSVSREPLTQLMAEEYQIIDSFVKLMQLCAQ